MAKKRKATRRLEHGEKMVGLSANMPKLPKLNPVPPTSEWVVGISTAQSPRDLLVKHLDDLLVG